MKTKTKTTITKKTTKINYEEMYNSMNVLLESLKKENIDLLSKNLTRRNKVDELYLEIDGLKQDIVIWSVSLFMVGVLVGILM
jgi:hypothetical protein